MSRPGSKARGKQVLAWRCPVSGHHPQFSPRTEDSIQPPEPYADLFARILHASGSHCCPCRDHLHHWERALPPPTSFFSPEHISKMTEKPPGMEVLHHFIFQSVRSLFKNRMPRLFSLKAGLVFSVLFLAPKLSNAGITDMTQRVWRHLSLTRKSSLCWGKGFSFHMFS